MKKIKKMASGGVTDSQRKAEGRNKAKLSNQFGSKKMAGGGQVEGTRRGLGASHLSKKFVNG